jgi:hypothetical protein
MKLLAGNFLRPSVTSSFLGTIILSAPLAYVLPLVLEANFDTHIK